MKKFLVAILIVAWACNLPAQQGFSSLEERMTGKEFMAAGLDKLSDEELAALNEWLRSHSVATLPTARPHSDMPQAAQPAVRSAPQGDTRGFEIETMKELDDSTIVSRLVGTFSGWDGGTVFRLENGMIWEQIETSKFSISPVENPVVTIESGLFNSWRLSLEGYNKTVKVKRIQ